MARAIVKYLAGHAEQEAQVATRLDGNYENVLVVPACREDADLLEGFVTAATTSPGATLVVLVVNGRVDAPESVHIENESTLSTIVGASGACRVSAHPEPPIWFAEMPAFDLVVIDRASQGFRFPSKQGVGLARKIGADMALRLFSAGRTGRFVFFTDADARLPPGHFRAQERPPADAAFLSFPFWHEDGGDEAVDRATALHEISLRYYVSGLRWAGSPYAFQTLGSAVAIDLSAYAAVRGVPKREAGEDFYLLNKLAKVGSAFFVDGEPVVLRARRSDRTPFGTGSATEKLRNKELFLYDPRCFVALRTVLGALSRFCEHRSNALLRADIAALPAPSARALMTLWDDIGADFSLRAIADTVPTSNALLRAVHGWFDGFRTLKLVHAVTASCFPKRSWPDAFVDAPFTPDPSANLAHLRHVLAAREAWRGPGP